jgi:hypothetical protein
MESKKNILSDITNDLRGKAGKYNWIEAVFKIALLVFSAVNTVRVFSESFSLLGLMFIVFALIFFDGGYLYWEFQQEKFAAGTKQRKISEVGGWTALIAVVAMIFIDFTLHSGQDYINLDAEVKMIGGWIATNRQIFGAVAMCLVPAVFAIHMVCLKLFRSHDVAIMNKIEGREISNLEAVRELNVKRARNKVQAQLTADSIDRVGADYESIKGQVSAEMSKSLIPDILYEFGVQMRRTNVINAEVREIPADNVTADDLRGVVEALNRVSADVAELKASRAYTADTEQPQANFTQPAKGRTK